MKQLYILLVILFLFPFTQLKAQILPVSEIYSDYNGYWTSQVGSNNSIQPDNEHNLIGFTWNGTTYSTGVDDNLLTTNGVTFIPSEFSALPISALPNPNNNTFVGVGLEFGGSGNVQPVPVNNNISKYLVDGENGLGLGTGIFNFPGGSTIQFSVESLNPAAIGDGIPDLLLTQIGDPPRANNRDNFSFRDENGNIVGQEINVNFSSISVVAGARWKFYNLNTNPPTYNQTVSGEAYRDMRLLALDWEDFGLTLQNISSVATLQQVFSGMSDLAFSAASNSESIVFRQLLSGTVFQDPDGGTPNGNGYGGVQVTLTNSANQDTVTTTNADGDFLFTELVPGEYTIEIEVPTNFEVLGNFNGNQLNVEPVTIENEPRTEVDFGINAYPEANDLTINNAENTEGEETQVPALPVSDAEDGSPTTITITTIPNSLTEGILYYDGQAVIDGQVIENYDPTLLTIDPINQSNVTVTFNYTTTDSTDLQSEEGTVTMVINVTLLPVELVEFTAIPNWNNAVLNWQTSTEINNSHFEILRSVDGINFQQIDELSGAGTTTETQNYDYIDVDAGNFGNFVYYKLRQVDFDGETDITDVRLVQFDDSSIGSKVYPNPIQTGSSLQVEANAIKSISIYTSNGQLQNEFHFAGENVVTLPTNQLSKGIYILIINNTQQQKFVVQ